MSNDCLYFVYRVFDATDRLLYVGCSGDVEARMAQHEANAPWFLFHDRVERSAYSSREAAEAAESEAIATEHPRWNIVGRSQDHPDGFTRSLRNAPWLAVELDMDKRWRKLAQEVAQLESKLVTARAQQAILAAQMDAHPAVAARVTDLASYRRSA